MKSDIPKDQDKFYEDKELSQDIRKRRAYIKKTKQNNIHSPSDD